MDEGLLQRIEAFLVESAIPQSVFGHETARDPRLVHDLRAGRRCGRRLVCRMEHFMNKWRADRRAGHVRPRGDLRFSQPRRQGEN
jgi:hypothetical protein